MKPFTLKWWLTWKEYVHDMLIGYDELSDSTVEAINPNHGYTDEEVEYIWDEYNRYYRLNEWMRKRIINKYGE